jgi:hypothetical protein
VFKVNNFPDYWEAEEFDSIDTLFSKVANDEKQPYCFGLNFIKNFDENETQSIYDLEIQFSFNKGMVVDTNSPAYDDHVMSPDFDSWGSW